MSNQGVDCFKFLWPFQNVRTLKNTLICQGNFLMLFDLLLCECNCSLEQQLFFLHPATICLDSWITIAIIVLQFSLIQMNAIVFRWNRLILSMKWKSEWLFPSWLMGWSKRALLLDITYVCWLYSWKNCYMTKV